MLPGLSKAPSTLLDRFKNVQGIRRRPPGVFQEQSRLARELATIIEGRRLLGRMNMLMRREVA